MLDESFVRDKYNNISAIWDDEDIWHSYTRERIESLIREVINTTELKEKTFLFAGSAGNNNGITANTYIHLDIAERFLEGKDNSIVGSIQNLPIRSESVDYIVCVGSVINYTDPADSIKEFNRVLKKDGKIIIEFEKSDSAEYLFTRHFMKKKSMVNTFYQNKNENIFVFSEKSIKSILNSNNLTIIKWTDFHIASAIIYRLTKNIDFSVKFCKFDEVLSRTSIKKLSCNSFIFIQKN